MGVEAQYMGRIAIPEDKKKILLEQMLRVLNVGGMMQLSEAPDVCEKDLILIDPITKIRNKDGNEEFHFSYFEDDSWSSAYLHQDGTIHTFDKVGGCEFGDVIAAAYTLMEHFSDAPGGVEYGGSISSGWEETGWLNQILGTRYASKHWDFWPFMEEWNESLLGTGYYGEEDMNDIDQVLQYVPLEILQAADGMDIADMSYTKGIDFLDLKKLEAGGYPEVVYKCRETLKTYFDAGMDEERIAAIHSLARMPAEERAAVKGELETVAKMSLKLHARVLIYLTAGITEKPFWTVWLPMRKEVYHDEDVSSYITENLAKARLEARQTPVPPVRTSTYLRQTHWFHDTPDELKGKPPYYLSDDDRLFWWDGSDEVILSEKMEQWLEELGKRHQELLKDLELPEGDVWLTELTGTLAEENDYFKKLYPFKSMYYEFLMHGLDPRYVAAIRLYAQLGQENREAGKVIEHVKYAWDMTSKNVTCNEGRMNMKRYLAVMANTTLRTKYFGF